MQDKPTHINSISIYLQWIHGVNSNILTVKYYDQLLKNEINIYKPNKYI